MTIADTNAGACPEWFARPQFGIFIHWSLSSIPAFAPMGKSIHDLMFDDYDNATILSPYAEWYENAMRVPGSPTAEFHQQYYGDAPYTAFQKPFEEASTNFDANNWADFFAEAGAEYVVMVTKHHDGYCLWPSEIINPNRPNWFSKRDFVGELADAVRARGMRFGLYYSGGLDWTFYNPAIRNLGEMFACVPPGEEYATYAKAQVLELIERYRPSVLWNDIAWPNKANLQDMIDQYRKAVPDGVVNDRWLAEEWLFESVRNPEGLTQFNNQIKHQIAHSPEGLSGGAPSFCDFRTIEYGMGTPPKDQKWEACRGIGNSFGYCANEPDSSYLTHMQFLEMKEATFAQNGNLLLNVGPMADGTIPTIQRRALLGDKA
jgi:alpha-L-fucosidase